MELTAFTTYDDIRAMIGVTNKELPDTDLALESYLYGLENELEAVGANLEDDYMAASTAVASGTETTTQKALYRATRLFATASVALAVAYSLPMRAQKSITDGKAGISRFSDSPFKETLNNLLTLAASAKSSLAVQFAASTGSTVLSTAGIPFFMAVVSPAVDPVTG